MFLTRKLSYFPLVCLLVACGGGGSGSTSTGSTINNGGSAAIVSSLSEDQRQFESFYLQSNGGAYQFHWGIDQLSIDFANLLTTLTYAEAKDLIEENRFTIAQSPLNFGSQAESREHYVSGDTKKIDTRYYNAYLINGAIVYSIVAESDENPFRYSYVGNTVRMDILALDNKTIISSYQLENLRSRDLIGGLINTPAEALVAYADLAQYLVYKKSQASYLPGAKYLLASKRILTDTFMIDDCVPVLRKVTSIIPCFENSNLQDALSKGIKAYGKTYFLNEGTVSKPAGTSVWISNSPRKDIFTGNEKHYRFFAEIGGKIYPGDLQYAGQMLLGDQVYDRKADAAPYLDYSVYLNKPARDSFVAAILKR
ncbi:hypothetical protein DFR42_102325 [Undibacterium pigrum]|uniref:Uncharacterized protein n=2 Tax=Undibacterium pigrum TaxID=401470 RepID=A0A318J9T0_9BURK|nr:hypothetical protein DFR42_102325 [Undibacterium pigrum]